MKRTLFYAGIKLIIVIGMLFSVVSGKIDWAIFFLLALILSEIEDIHQTIKDKP